MQRPVSTVQFVGPIALEWNLACILTADERWHRLSNELTFLLVFDGWGRILRQGLTRSFKGFILIVALVFSACWSFWSCNKNRLKTRTTESKSCHKRRSLMDLLRTMSGLWRNIIRSKNKIVYENTVTGMYGSCTLLLIGFYWNTLSRVWCTFSKH